MKRIGLAVALILSMTVFGVARSEDIRIGYVDMRKVLTETKAGKRVREDLEKLVKQRQESLNKDQQQLKNLEQTYEKERLLLSDTQKQAKQKEFDEKLKAFQQAAQQAEREIEQKRTDYERKVSPEIRNIIRDLAKEEKLTLVFERTTMPVLYATEGPDLTAKIIQRLDAKGG